MASQEEIREVRIQKLKKLKDAGMNPYPISCRRDATLKEIADAFETYDGKTVTVLGRIMAIRGQGGLFFADLHDGTAKFQAVLKEDVMDAWLFSLWNDAVDIGDFVEITGIAFVTKRGEKSVEAKTWRMLSKSLRALPEKWHGLQDVEERFRKRYLDLLMNTDVRDRFALRSRIISALRRILDEAGYLEVETSMLQPLAGGTNATPFKTELNALDIDLYLRIAPELDLKKLLIGGYPKVYEIGRNFRNEGIDMTHNPEFTMLEFYEAYGDSKTMRAFVESMMKALVATVKGQETLSHEGAEIDFSKPFAVVSYKDILRDLAGFDIDGADLASAQTHAEKLGLKVNPADALPKVIDQIYKKACRPKLVQPTFIIEYPTGMLPLAKRTDASPDYVDAFQFVVAGMELVKAFSELNDPIDQAERFNKEEENKKAGDTEAQSNDYVFLEAMEYGMPPAGGVGIGIDRLAMLLSDQRNIREVILFPTLRPKN